MKKIPYELVVWLRLSRLTHQVNCLSNDFLRQFDLTITQFEIMVQVATYQPITQIDLANKLTVTQGGISRLLSRMVEDELIIKKKEGKNNYIQLSPRGQKKLDDAYNKQVDYQVEMFKDLSKEEQKTLFRLLTKVTKTIQENE